MVPGSTAVNAYWNFFDTFNTRDAYSFASSLNYPHMRVTWRLDPTAFADAEAYALNQTWDALIDQGWDHSEGLEPRVIHESPDKVHIAGGWQRIDGEGKVILSNLVCYIATWVSGVWGIQCRFGTDAGSGSADLRSDQHDDSLRCAARFLQAVRDNDDIELSNVCTDNYHEVGIGRLSTFGERNWEPGFGRNPDLDIVHSGPRSATLSLSSESGGALLYMTYGDIWKVKATSWI